MKFKSYTKAYEKKVIDLLNVCFPERFISKRSFRWKHFDHSFQNKEIAYIALDGEVVCSFVCFTPVMVSTPNGILNFYSCAVQATHPKYRRKGLVKRLTLQVEKDVGLSAHYIGFSNSYGMQIDLNSKSIGYRILGELVTNYMISLASFPKYTIRDVSQIDTISDVETIGNTSEIQKSTPYVQWKFYRCPIHQYQYLEIMKDGIVVGYAVTNKSLFVYRILYIYAANDRLIRDCINAVRYMAIRKKRLVTSFTFMPNDWWKSILPMKIVQKKSGIYFAVKSQSEYLMDRQNWNIQAGDVQ